MRIILCAFILCLTTQAYAWDTTDTVMQAAVTAAITADWMQTRDIARHSERFYENNPILGKHPHKDKVDGYFAACIIGHAAISYLLPESVRAIWQTVWIGVEVTQTAANANAGVRIQF